MDTKAARIVRWAYLICAAFLFMASPAFGESRTARVGVYQNKPKVFTDENGKATGFFIDLLAEIAKVEGWKLDYVSCEWSECLRALEDGRIDLMPDVAYSQERDKRFDFHRTPVVESWSQLYSNPGKPIRTMSDVNGKRIALLGGGIQKSSFEQMISGFGFKATIVPTESLEEAFQKVKAGDADAAVANHFFGDHYYREYGLVKSLVVFQVAALYYATANGRNHDLLQAIDRHLDAWVQEPNSTYYKVLSRWIEKAPERFVPRYILWIIGITLGSLALAGGLILLLRMQVRERTKRLALANDELKAIYNNAPVMIAMLDENRRVLYANPEFTAFTGASEDDLKNGCACDVFGCVNSTDDPRGIGFGANCAECALKLALDDTIQNGNSHRDIEYRTTLVRDGDRREVVLLGATIGVYEGGRNNVLLCLIDVTERKRAEEELRRLNTELEQKVIERTADLALAKERAESADRLKSAFLASMSHELRTPLNSIIGFTGIVLQGLPGPLNPEQSKQLGMVQESARHLLSLINDVLDLSKIEAGQIEIEVKPFDVRDSVEKVARLVAPLVEKKQLTLTSDVSPDVGELTSDRRRFEQILINLINNAVKFTQEGKVSVECAIKDRYLVTRVTDTGIGIKKEDMGKLFHTFRQIDTGLSRNHEGSGLGLSICKKLVEMLGGNISVESEWGVGSTFSFTLPLELD